ncbi:MAG: hypothetical protein ACI35W_03970 [Anaeroplasmataceae bacterium]
MDALLEWLKTWDWSAVLATLIGLAATYGGSILILIISLIKTRVKNFNYKQALENAKIDLSNQQLELIENLKDSIVKELSTINSNLMSQNSEAAAEQKKIIQDIVDDANRANEEIQEVSVANASEVLNGLGE